MSEPEFDFDLERMKEAVEGPSIRIPMGLSREARREYINKMLHLIDNAECSKCGCVGLHACTGAPTVWTEEDEKRLNEALIRIAREENR